jgi:hypothetical protein
MVCEGEKEEEERLSNERMRRMKSLMLAMRIENDCDDFPLSESWGEEMAENDCASMISTDVGDDNIRYIRYSTSVRELDNSCHSLNSTSTQVESDKVVSWTTTPTLPPLKLLRHFQTT